MAAVSFAGVGKVYPDGTRAVEDLTLEIADGEFMVFVGPSGCGKTTALRMAAGLEAITEGEIRIGDAVVNDIEPRKRDIAMVFQNYSLYPHMSVFENIAFPLRSQRVPRGQIRPRVDRVAQLLAIEDLLKRRPGQLSGGQRQRVAMGRALVREPQVFLMDEPLSNLDAKLRVQMRAEISGLQRELQITTIYVTHDQVEAMTMGSRIAVMRKGRIQQVGPPQALYDRPVNLFVASFVGSPPMNLVRATIVDKGSSLEAHVGDQSFALPEAILNRSPALAAYRDRDVALGVRPEHVITATGEGNGPAARLRAEVKFVETLGFESLVYLELAAEPVMSDALLEIAQDIDAATASTLADAAKKHRAPIIARSATRTDFEPGEVIEITVPLKEVSFFDHTTGQSLTSDGAGDTTRAPRTEPRERSTK